VTRAVEVIFSRPTDVYGA